MRKFHSFLCRMAAIAAILCLSQAAAATESKRYYKVEVGPQPVTHALKDFARQTKLQVIYYTEVAEGLASPGATGTLSADDALVRILGGTGLEYVFVNDRTVAIRVPRSASKADGSASTVTGNGLRLVNLGGDEPQARPATGSGTYEEQASAEREAGDKTAERDARGTPEILVKGKRTLNTDIERTEDDPQPYVVFSGEDIKRSQAVNLEDFLRTRLPMNTAQGTAGQTTPGLAYSHSGINLRGLGANQTLILVDGRRMSSVANQGNAAQPDLNGIPLSAIERIEILPSTAGGIYGGSATGGVINVILRRDFQGVEVGTNYVNAFDTDVGHMRFDASAGFNLEGGRTQITMAAAYTDANKLVVGDRDFSARGVALQLRNNPATILNNSAPPLGATVNIRSTSGPLVLDSIYGGTALGYVNTHIPLGYAGPASDSGAALVRNAGQYNLGMPAGAGGKERGLMAVQSMKSVTMNVRREFTPWLDAFIDMSRLGNEGGSFLNGVTTAIANLPASAPNNPFQQNINVRFPTPQATGSNDSSLVTLRGTGGLIARLPLNWTGEIDYAWSRARLKIAGTVSLIDQVGACVLGRGVAANVDPDGTGSLMPCNASNPADARPALNALQEGNTFPLDLSPYANPTPDLFQGPYETVLKNATLRFSGPAFNLPAGPVNISTLIERRKETLENAFQFQRVNPTLTSYTFYPRRFQETDSYYAEVRAPLISPRSGFAFARELQLQLSARHDQYFTTTGALPAGTSTTTPTTIPALAYTTTDTTSTDYTVGLRYSPVEDIALRASYGTGFLPPSVGQIVSTSLTGLPFSQGNDPKRGNTSMYVGQSYTFVQGGNPNLRPEDSRSTSAGIILTPRFMPGLRLSVDYTRIKKMDEIVFLFAQFLLDNEDFFPGRIVRGNRLSSDPAGWAGPITYFDTSYANMARTTLEAYDIQADYMLATKDSGEFHGYATVTRQAHMKNQTALGAPFIERVGYASSPLEWRGNIGMDWVKGPLTLGWNAQYYDSYFVYGALALPLTPAQVTSRATTVMNQGSNTIPSQMYHDIIMTYRVEGAPRAFGWLLTDTEISVGIQNLFNRSPPIIATTDPSGAGYSTYGDPRLRRYSINVRKNFGN